MEYNQELRYVCNMIGDNCECNMISDNCVYNMIGDNCECNIICDNCVSNIIGKNSLKNQFNKGRIFSMKFKRIGTDTVRCIISEDELTENGMQLDDFLANSERTEDFLRKVISLAEQEVGFKSKGGPLTVQVAVLPEKSIALTFSEKQPGNIMELLETLKDAMTHLGEAVEEAKEEALKNTRNPDGKYLLCFSSMDEVIAFCTGVTEGLEEEYGMDSALYYSQQDEEYYMLIKVASLDEKKLCRFMTVSIEFMDGITGRPGHLAFVEEHYKCVIKTRAITQIGSLKSNL